MTTFTLNAYAIDRYLRLGDLDSIRRGLAQTHPADIAAALGDLPLTDQARALTALEPARQAEVFGYLDPATQTGLAQSLERGAFARLFGAMAHDERADLFATLPEAAREALLPALAQAERDDLLKLASYPAGTAGAVMTSDYATLSPELTAAEAIAHLRRVAPDAETIYQTYVIDQDRRLIGTASLRDLIVARDGARVAEILRPDPVVLRAEDPQVRAVELIRKYDLIAVPVINGGGKLVGIVTYDDAMDVAEEVETIRFGKTSAVGGLGRSILEASVGLLYRKRIAWLLVLVFGNLFSGAGIAYFEDTIAAHVALVFFLPLLVDSGGNAGSQSATLMVRALATGEVRLRDWGRMLGREVLVAGLLGLTMAVAVSGIGLWRGGPEIAAVVALTMVLIVLVGSVVGMSLPFLLSRFRLDPATASAPLITSLADAIGVVIYFAMATWFLGVGAG